MWSEETLRLRDRYNQLYGFGQGLGVAAALCGLTSPWVEWPPPALWGLILLSWVMLFVWRRWGWRPYRAAYQRDLDAWVRSVVS